MREYIVRESGYPGTIKQEIVQELVRCGECKHYNDGWCYNPNTYDDEKTRGNTSPDWYCADGERKGVRMMLIDAVALRKAMYHEAMEKDSDESKWESGCWIRYKMFERVLKTQPTIDPVKRGRWIHDGQQHRSGVDWMHCSECGYRDAIEAESIYHYCPNCGARMTEGEEDETD